MSSKVSNLVVCGDKHKLIHQDVKDIELETDISLAWAYSEACGSFFSSSNHGDCFVERSISHASCDLSWLEDLRLKSRRSSNCLKYFDRYHEREAKQFEHIYLRMEDENSNSAKTHPTGHAILDNAKQALSGKKSTLATFRRQLDYSQKFFDQSLKFTSTIVKNAIHDMIVSSITDSPPERNITTYDPKHFPTVESMMDAYLIHYTAEAESRMATQRDAASRVRRMEISAACNNDFSYAIDSTNDAIENIVHLRGRMCDILLSDNNIDGEDPKTFPAHASIAINAALIRSFINAMEEVMIQEESTSLDSIHPSAKDILLRARSLEISVNVQRRLIKGRFDFINRMAEICSDEAYLKIHRLRSMTPYVTLMRLKIGRMSNNFIRDAVVVDDLQCDVEAGKMIVAFKLLLPNHAYDGSDDYEKIRSFFNIPPSMMHFTQVEAMSMLNSIGGTENHENAIRLFTRSSNPIDVWSRGIHLLSKYDLKNGIIPSISPLIAVDQLLTSSCMFIEMYDTLLFAHKSSAFSQWRSISMLCPPSHPLSSSTVTSMLISLSSLASKSASKLNLTTNDTITVPRLDDNKNSNTSNNLKYSEWRRSVISNPIDLESMVILAEQSLRLWNTANRWIKTVLRCMVNRNVYRPFVFCRLDNVERCGFFTSLQLYISIATLLFPLILCNEIMKYHFGDDHLDGKPFDARVGSTLQLSISSFLTGINCNHHY